MSDAALATRPDRTLCWSLAQYVAATRYEDLPAGVVAKAKAILIHDLAVAFGGVATDQGRRAVAFIETRQGPATVIGQAFRASTLDAGLANSVLGRALRMEDTILPSFIHPGAVLIPAALATAEACGAGGRDVIAGLAAGYDVLGRTAGSLWSWEHGNRTATHIFGALGVAALAARIMRLDVEQTACALAYAADLSALITYGFQDFQYGVVTRNGLLAARLGQVRAPFPDDALEGPYGFYAVQLGGARPTDAEILGELGRRFEIMTAVLKPHTCTALNLVPLELVRRIVHEHAVPPGAVSAIRVTRSREAARVPNVHSAGPFPDGPEAFFAGVTSSLPFALAALLVDGEVTATRFERANDRRIEQAMRGVHIQLSDDPDLLAHTVEVALSDGRRFTAAGGREVLTAPDAQVLLQTHGAPVVGEARAAELWERVAALETATSLDGVAACLRGTAA